MVFRVQCVDKASGTQSDRMYRAESADRAAELAMRDGYIVGHVYPEAEPPMHEASASAGNGGAVVAVGGLKLTGAEPGSEATADPTAFSRS